MDQQKLFKIEKYLFLTVLVFTIIPVLLGHFFLTLDGPAHLYNAQLINTYLSGSDRLMEFIQINPEPVPNWTGHFILSLLTRIFPGWMAEKCLLIMYLAGLSYAFRYLIKQLAPSTIFASYFIFPFCYSHLFILGFYNFSIALVLLFFIIGFWVKKENELFSFKNILKLFLLITALYFSHVFVFAVALLTIGLYILFKFLTTVAENKAFARESLSVFVKQSGSILIASAIPLILFSFYFFSRGTPQNSVFLSKESLFSSLLDLHAITAYFYSTETSYTHLIVGAIGFSLVISLFLRIRDMVLSIRSAQKMNAFSILGLLKTTDVWLFSAIIFLFLYFTSPDSNNFGGFITIRLSLIFYLFSLIWIASQPLPKWIILIVTSLFMYCQFNLIISHSKAAAQISSFSKECHEMAAHIKPNSVVLPLNHSGHWLGGHISNYLGADKPLIILENYEGDNDYFPLKWNAETIPTPIIGNRAIHAFPCIPWRQPKTNRTVAVEYILLIGDIDQKEDTCNTEIAGLINHFYKKVHESGAFKLYQLKLTSNKEDSKRTQLN